MIEKSKSQDKGNFEEKDRLWRLLNWAFLTDKSDRAIMAIKDDHPDATRLAREALADILTVLLPGIVNPYLDNTRKLFNHLEETLVQHVRDSAAEHKTYEHKLNDLEGKVDGLVTEQKSLISDHGRHMLEMLLPHGALRKRFVEDHPNEKGKIARYVTQTFFFSRSTIRCFVQASTTAIRLGHHLLQNSENVQDCLVYTNSAAVPITILKEDSPFRVYAFCGPSYDPICGGWLFGEGDTETPTELRKLFTRPHDPLTLAFLAPLTITLDGSLYYMRKEAARMAAILRESAKQVVIMVPANRIYENSGQFPSTSLHFQAKVQTDPPPDAKTDVVISGSPHFGSLADHVNAFVATGMRVHWFDDSSRRWIIVPK